MSNLPFVSSAIPKDLRAFLERVRESLFGTGNNRAVTVQELVDAGVLNTTPGGGTISATPRIGTPPVPQNFAASGALANVILTWDAPRYVGHSHAEIWVSDTDDLGDAVLLGLAPGATYIDNVGSSATRYYWIRFVNILNTVGKYNSTNGTSGTTGDDPDYLIQVLSDEYGVTGDAPFFQLDSPTEINGVTVPAGTYIKQAFIADATVSRAKIQDLAVDDAKIASLAVNKLTAGSIAAGQYIQSSNYQTGVQGFRINASGVSEFSDVTVRGAVFASSGSFSGTISASTILGGNAVSYVTGNGLYSGLLSGSYVFRVGDPNGNRLTWDGTTLGATNINISNGTLTAGLIKSTDSNFEINLTSKYIRIIS